MKPFSKDTPRYREIIFLTTSALFMFNTISYHSEPCVCHSEPFVRHSEPFTCHSEPFVSHSERSEESRCSAQDKLHEESRCHAQDKLREESCSYNTQGKLREEFHCFALG